MSEEVTPDAVRAAIANTDPVLEALSILLREVASDAVHTLAALVAMTGADPTEMPGAFLLQAVLVEADKVFKPISRETWIEFYDAYHAVKEIIAADPTLAESLVRKGQEIRAGQFTDLSDAAQDDGLLDGQF